MPREAPWSVPQDRLKVYASLGALAAVLLTGALALTALVAFASPAVDYRTYAGSIGQFEVEKPVAFLNGKFWVVKQADGGLVAFYSRSPHLGCKVAWLPDFSFPDPATGQMKVGWFRDPCSDATWDVNGVGVFGPAPRNLDRFPVEVDGHRVYVDANVPHLVRGDRK